MINKLLKQIVVNMLGRQVRRLVKRNNLRVVAVAGSVGKTSTKFVIAKSLAKEFRVCFQEGNYNDALTVPLIFFEVENPPNLFNPFKWLKIFLGNEKKIKASYPYDLVVVELGTDGPGQMKIFKQYIRPNVGVLTSIGHEHMEFFKTIDAVAEEELTIADLCENLVVGIDDVSKEYTSTVSLAATYGTSSLADYFLLSEGSRATIKHGNHTWSLKPKLIGRHIQKALAAAVAVAETLGIKINQEFIKHLESIEPVPGRMQLLNGKNGATIIDDTYNNVSPDPAIAALDVLYDWPAKRRIAVLGNMNELGDHSKEAHVNVGKYCDPGKLDQVLTIGPDANTYLKEAALKRGCKVESFDSPHKIGEALEDMLTKDTVILVKGSQNKVFLEEAIKPLLSDKSDISKLVRQSPEWLKTKASQFEESI